MAVLIPIALEIKTGKSVTPDEVPRGMACDCECLFCGVPVLAKQGKDGFRWFSHQPRVVDEEKICEISFARCLFWMARKVLSEHKHIRLPAYTLKLSDQDTRLVGAYTVTPERSIEYEQASFPDTQISTHHDTAILYIKGHILQLQLYFDSAGSTITGDCTTATLAINISSLESIFNQGKSNFKEVTEKALLENTANKRWIYHPREENARQQFKTAAEEARQKKLLTPGLQSRHKQARKPLGTSWR